MCKVSESQPGFMLPGPCNKWIDFFFSHQNKCQKVLWLFNKGEKHPFSNERNGYGLSFGVAGSSVEPPSSRSNACKDTHAHRVRPNTSPPNEEGSSTTWFWLPTALPTELGKALEVTEWPLQSVLGPCRKSSFLGRTFLPLKKKVIVAICLNHTFPWYFLDSENPNAVQLFRRAMLGFLCTHPDPSGFPYRSGMQHK